MSGHVERTRLGKMLSFDSRDSREILAGTSITAGMKLAGILLQYLFLTIISRHLGAAPVGYYAVTVSVVIITATISTLGFNQAILRATARNSWKEHWSGLLLLHRRMITASFIVSLVFGAILVASADYLIGHFYRGSATRVFIYCAAFALPGHAIMTINADAMRGLKRISVSEYYRTVSVPLISCVLLAVLLKASVVNTVMPTAIYAAALVVTALLSTMTAHRYLAPGSVVDRKINAPSFNRDMMDSIQLLIIVLATMVMEYGGILMMGWFTNARDAGVYSIAFRLSMAVSLVLAAVNSIVAPKFAESYWNGGRENFVRIVRFSSRILFWTATPVVLVLMAYPAWLLNLFGHEFGEGAGILRLLCIGQFVNAVSGSVGYLLIMTGGHAVFRNIMVVSAAAFLLLGLVLTPRMGGSGLALAATASMISWNIASAVYIKRTYNVRTWYLPFFAEKLK